MSDVESDDNEGNAKNTRTMIIVLMLLGLCMLLLIIAIIVSFLFQGLITGKDKSHFASLTVEERADTTLDDVLEICAIKEKKLPVPQSRDEEKTLIKNIKAFHNEMNCSKYMLGYKLDSSVRYQSTDGKMEWPPLSKDNGAAIPKVGRDCVQIGLKTKTQTLEIGTPTQCDRISMYHCVVGYAMTADYCEFRRLWCLFAVDVIGHTPDEIYASFKRSVLRYDKQSAPYGILLVDKNHQALDMTSLSFSSHDLCYALDVKYVLKYKNIYTNEDAPYDIKVKVYDPEMECLVVNTDKFQIETAPCSRHACALCEE